MRKISIVPMVTDTDIAGKGYVHWKSWHETYTGLVDPTYMEKLTLEKCADLAHRRPENILVAKDADNVIGFVGYGAYRDDALAHCGEVFAIYVLADYHRQKVGYALMNAALEKMANHRKIAVWVLEGNNKAIRFYERYGFVSMAHRRKSCWVHRIPYSGWFTQRNKLVRNLSQRKS